MRWLPTPREHGPAPLVFQRFDSSTFPGDIEASNQVEYLRCYLGDLGAASVIHEAHYFDRDYLAEFSAFYAASSRGYSNACRRTHVFALSLREARCVVYAALAGDRKALELLQQNYLGFMVIRPIGATPLGRTVLRWYPETNTARPRVVKPSSRRYHVHLAGLPLYVEGLAWQQQDTAVGACATVALWTMFHAAALDDHHAIPTTAEITMRASRRLPLGRRVFPAIDGLSVHQLCEAIRAQGLQPAVLEGDVLDPTTRLRTFSLSRFSASCGALLRSGFPTLIAGKVAPNGVPTAEGHAVCAVGLRPGATVTVPMGDVREEDAALEHLYIHDDNLGPSVRFAVTPLTLSVSLPIAMLVPDSRPPLARDATLHDPTIGYPGLVPTTIVAALPDEIRLTSDYLNERALELGADLSDDMSQWATSAGTTLPGITCAARFFKLSEYISEELERRLNGRRLAKARLAFANCVRPMSLHLGVVRLGIAGTPLLDVLFDTTDSQPATSAFGHVVFQRYPTRWLDGGGTTIAAF